MKQYKLFENTPAEVFEDAHLLGNGSLGASVFGGVPYEKILINHDTLWSGREHNKSHPGTRRNLTRARELILAGRLKEANNLVNDEMLGYWSECYLPLGTLHITLGQADDWRSMKLRRLLQNDIPYENYSRTLSLNEAVERVEYDQGGVHYVRELFASFPDGVVAVRLGAVGGKLCFALAIDSELRHEAVVSGHAVALSGRAPDRTEPYDPITEPKVAYLEDVASDSLRFSAYARVADTDGEISETPFQLTVSGASYAVILLAAGTNYAGYKAPRDRDGQHVLAMCEETVARAASKGYDQLKKAHIADYAALFGRVDVDIGEGVTDQLPTSRRLAMVAGPIDDASVSALALQYARYLAIAASRPGSQAMHLQGIWNPQVVPPWASNYTTNINVEMNYWAVEALNLAECHLPLADLVRELADSGVAAARDLYGAGGWVAHHNTDLWRMATIAGDDAAWCWWPFGGVWLCRHLWEHYLYAPDEGFLRDVIYPVFRGAARFLLDFLTEDADGFLVSPPSTSPENKFLLPGYTLKGELVSVGPDNRFHPNDPQVCAVCKASTMDMAMARELLGNFIEAADRLGIGDGLIPKAKNALARLYPFKAGRHGQLQEWDEDYEECTPGMGHMSHLYPVYPSNVITKSGSPEFFAAAEKAFLRRHMHGGLKHGWPGAWAISLAARFGNATVCAEINKSVAAGMAASMLMTGNYQIDCILGWAAGVAEMLLQSHDGCIELLPALPVLWSEGTVKGMRARGGFTVGMKWEKSALSSACIASEPGGACIVKYGCKTVSIHIPAGESVRLDGQLNVLGEESI